MENFKNNPLVKKIGFNRLVLIGVMILMYILFSIGSIMLGNGKPLGMSNIMSAFNYAYFLGFLAMGVTFVIGTGGIDFSIGPVMFCAALIGGRLMVKDGWAVVPSLLICILVGCIFGIVNGYLVAYLDLPSFISSMALMMVAKGVGSVFTKTQTIKWPQATDESGKGWFRNVITWKVNGIEIPMGVILLILTAVICAIILNNTKAGRYILCIGSNKEAVRLSGVNVRKWEMLAYVFCGILAGIASIFYVAAYSTVAPGLGDTFNNEAIAACVMGGTSMAGGVASIVGSIIGAFIIALLQVGILAMKFQKDYQYVITGIIVLLAVYADIRSKKRKN